jgi:hypothetical protein
VIYGVGVYLCCLDELICVHLGLFTLFLLSCACIFIFFHKAMLYLDKPLFDFLYS